MQNERKILIYFHYLDTIKKKICKKGKKTVVLFYPINIMLKKGKKKWKIKTGLIKK